MAAAEPGAILAVEALTMRFGGLTAVDHVDWSVEAGEIHGVIGPNGAGKTTLFNMVAGFLSPTSGRIVFEGRDITARNPEQRCSLGVARTFQVPKPFGGLSVRDNVAVGLLPASRTIGEARARAGEILELLEITRYGEELGSVLSVGLRKRLEVARALSTRPKLLLLDEVMGGLHGHEVDQMIETVRTIAGRGVTVVMIEHVMPAVIALAGRITVLDQGRIIATGTPEEVTQDQAVIAAYLGDELVS